MPVGDAHHGGGVATDVDHRGSLQGVDPLGVDPGSYGVAMVAGPDLNSIVERNRTEILDLVRRHRGRSIGVFGSVARGEATSESDIDFVVEFEPSSSLLDLVHLEEALAELLGVDVDVVSAGALLERDAEIRSDAIALKHD